MNRQKKTVATAPPTGVTLSPQERLQALDARLGPGGASRERAKLMALIPPLTEQPPEQPLEEPVVRAPDPVFYSPPVGVTRADKNRNKQLRRELRSHKGTDYEY